MRKKQSFTLIELVISLSLLTLLITTLFFWYSHLHRKKAHLKEMTTPIQEVRYAQQRLNHFFSNTSLFCQEEKVGYFFTSHTSSTDISNPSLVFSFDIGPTETPELSNQVLARLYHNPHTHSLQLAIWPHPKKDQTLLTTPTRTTTLLEQVKEIKCHFYAPPDLTQLTVSPNEVGTPLPQEGWQDSWDNAYNQLPTMIKIEIKRVGKKDFIELAFSLFQPIPIKSDKV